MAALDKIRGRIKYYLLEYRDENMNEFISKYGNVRLRDLSIEQLKAYFNYATLNDKQKFK